MQRRGKIIMGNEKTNTERKEKKKNANNKKRRKANINLSIMKRRGLVTPDSGCGNSIDHCVQISCFLSLCLSISISLSLSLSLFLSLSCSFFSLIDLFLEISGERKYFAIHISLPVLDPLFFAVWFLSLAFRDWGDQGRF